MNYYPRHLGDYARDTAHLSMLEHGAYTLLLDRYYASESGIPDDQKYRITRARSAAEKNAVNSVLGEFFTLTENQTWTKHRVEEEIEKANKKITAARNNGKNGGRPKKTSINNEPTESEKPNGLSLGHPDQTEMQSAAKAPQPPRTNPQSQTPTVNQSSTENTNKGELCKALKRLQIEVTPHMPTLQTLLDNYSTEQILHVAQTIRDKKPGERIHINYLLPVLAHQRQSRKPAADNFDNKDYGQGGAL